MQFVRRLLSHFLFSFIVNSIHFGSAKRYSTKHWTDCVVRLLCWYWCSVLCTEHSLFAEFFGQLFSTICSKYAFIRCGFGCFFLGWREKTRIWLVEVERKLMPEAHQQMTSTHIQLALWGTFRNAFCHQFNAHEQHFFLLFSDSDVSCDRNLWKNVL